MDDELKFCYKCFCCMFALIVLFLSVAGILALLTHNPCILDPTFKPAGIPYIARTSDNKTSVIFDGNLIFDINSTDHYLPLELADISQVDISPHFYDLQLNFACALIHVYPYSNKGFDLIIENIQTQFGYEDRCVIKSLLVGMDRIRSCVSQRTGLTVAFLNITNLKVTNDYQLT